MKSLIRTLSFCLLAICPFAVSALSGAIELGLQAYTFRQNTLAETLDKAATMKIRYIQGYGGQRISDKSDAKFGHTMDAAAIAEVRALFKAKKMTLVSYGVVTGKDEADWRKIFAFAKEMGMKEIATEPKPEDMPLVAKLSAEYGINVAIHNHPPPTRYYDPAVALAAVKPYGKNIGLCADTGHWVRSGFDPVDTLTLAQGRILQLHFKDLSEAGIKSAHDMPWGTGISNAAGQILELRRQGFNGIVYMEYEYISPALDAEAAASAEFFRRALAASDKDLRAGRVLPADYVDENHVGDNWAGNRGKASARWATPVPLFDDKLSNAEFAPGSWEMKDGVLSAKGGGDIWTKANYSSFALNLDFRCEEKSNSGVFLRCSDTVNWLHSAIEVQILQGDVPNDKHLVGGIFDVSAPNRQIEIEPGKWYHMTIIAKGDSIQVSIDGERVTNISLDKWTTAGMNPDGTKNKFQKAYKDMAREGRIGFQYHKTPISFRNILVEELDKNLSSGR